MNIVFFIKMRDVVSVVFYPLPTVVSSNGIFQKKFLSLQFANNRFFHDHSL